MDHTGPAESISERTTWRLAMGLAAAWAAVQLAIGSLTPLDGDEVYYWEWSRRLQPGYFDHPPAIAVLIRGGVAIGGVTAFGVRVVPLIANLLGGWVLLATAKRLGGSRAALQCAILLFCLPILSAWLLLATPDNPLFLADAVALYAVVRALEEGPGSRASLGWWSAAGVASGLALQSKEMGILLPVGVLVALAIRRELRPRLRQPGPYLAAVIAFVIVWPVIRWNLENGSPFRFHLRKGLGEAQGSPVDQVFGYLGGQALFAGGILFGMLALAVVRALRAGSENRRFLLGVVSATAFGFFLLSSFRKPVEPNWPGPAYSPAIVLLAAAVGERPWRRWLHWGHALGGTCTALIWIHFLTPILPFSPEEDPIRRGRGWDLIASRVEALRRAEPEGQRVWIAANRFQDAGWLAFNLPDHPTVFSLNLHSRANQYSWWAGFPDLARPGDDLILLLVDDADAANIVRDLSPVFTKVEAGESFAPSPAVPEIQHRRLWVLQRWKGDWPVHGRPEP